MMLRVNSSAAIASERLINASLTTVDGTAAIGPGVTTPYDNNLREPTD